MRVVAFDAGVDERPGRGAIGRRQLPPVGPQAGGIHLIHGARQRVGGHRQLAWRDHLDQQLAVGGDAGPLQDQQLRELKLAQGGRVVGVMAHQTLGDVLGRPLAQGEPEPRTGLERERP